MNLKRYEIIKIAILTCVVLFSISMALGSLFFVRFVIFNDADLLPNGNLMICQYELVREESQGGIRSSDAVLIVDPAGNIVRQISAPSVPLDQPHEAYLKQDGNILIVNCRNDTILEVDPGNEIVWKYDLRLLNWTKVNSTFGPNNIVNKPSGNDWSHVNDIDLRVINATTQVMLVTVRNFDMLYEINYTSARQKSTPDESDITWYFGFPNNYTLLNHEHNADYLPDGNIIVADSENHRVIEINYTSRQITWSTEGQLDLFWARDANLCPWNHDLVLISDSLHHRIVEFNKSSGMITWEYYGNLVQPYVALYINETTILISDGDNGRVFLLNRETNEITREYDTPIGITQYARLLSIMILIIPLADLSLKGYETIILKKKIIKREFWPSIIVSIGVIGFALYILIFPEWLLKLLVVVINALIR
nr:aryl-sulfate sulfotransferase [Candidatus Sigynarchaeota archaeon]